ncbi:hypothetical protein ACVIKP_006618 [Rhizobium leguminosarum]
MAYLAAALINSRNLIGSSVLTDQNLDLSGTFAFHLAAEPVINFRSGQQNRWHWRAYGSPICDDRQRTSHN